MLLPVWLLLTGCATKVGYPFNYAVTPALAPGKLQVLDCLSTFGDNPVARDESTTMAGQFEMVRYVYGESKGGTARVHSVVLEFKNTLLNAFIYVSSFEGETNSVPLDKVDKIVNRVSTKAEVLKALGKPNGQARCPSMLVEFQQKCENCVEIWSWESLSTFSTSTTSKRGRGKNKPSIKSIYIAFDQAGVVSQIQTTDDPN